MYTKVVLLLVLTVLRTEAAKILGIFHFQSKSHHILGNTLLKELASRGHEVTMISPYPLESPMKNYENIELNGVFEYAAKNKPYLMEVSKFSVVERKLRANDYFQIFNEFFLNHSSIKELLKSNRKFDLVILNWFHNDAFLGIANHFKAPVIAFSTFCTATSANLITQNPSPYSYVPHTAASYHSHMTFYQRIANTFLNLFFDVNEHLFNYRQQEVMLHKYFPNAPPLQDLHSNISLFLINSHFSFENPRPYLPNMIQIGGFHVQESKESLNHELKTFLDSANEGIVFFSLGSNLKISEMTEDKLQAIIRTFEKLPLKVLWKFESEKVPKIPPNVKIGKWLPQTAILAHPNTKIFITHGGLLSVTEAIYYGVPFVGVPFFADQFYNVAESVGNGFAVELSYNELTEHTFTNAVNEVLINPKYRNNIKLRSLALRDQPLKPMDNAIYWVEYVLRHKGAPHLKAVGAKLKWYQYYLLDVLGLVALAFLIIICVVCKILQIFLKREPRTIKTKKSKKA